MLQLGELHAMGLIEAGLESKLQSTFISACGVRLDLRCSRDER
jgi:hypothetical protein